MSSAARASPTPERENEIEREIEQHLAAQPRELGVVVESLATVQEEFRALPAAVSQMREMLPQVGEMLPQLAVSADDGTESDGCSLREEICLRTEGLHTSRNQRGTQKCRVVRACVISATVDTSVA